MFYPLRYAICPTRYRENGHFEASPLKMAIFPVSRGTNRISQGVEHRGSLISVPWALRVFQINFFCAGTTPILEKNAPRMKGRMKIFHSKRGYQAIRVASQRNYLNSRAVAEGTIRPTEAKCLALLCNHLECFQSPQ